VPPTFLIAAGDAISILQEQSYLRDAQVFDDADALKALEVISTQQQPLVVIEQSFAATVRGQAFIDLLTSALKGSGGEFRVVGARRAARHRVNEPVTLDGNPATLVDISLTGAHIVSALPVKPQQRVRVSLRDGDRALTGTAVWVQLELPQDGPRYRAGVRFVPSDSAALAEFISEITR